MLRNLITFFAGLFGLAFGSFLNVCITRWPAGKSAAQGRSHCPKCGHLLPWWENIPLLSWLILGNRCRGCHSPIGWRYPLVELATATLWALASWRFLSTSAALLLPDAALSYELVLFAAMAILLWLLTALAILDWEYLWLPDRLLWPGIVLGLFFTYLLHGIAQRLDIAYPKLLSAWTLPRTMAIDSWNAIEASLCQLPLPAYRCHAVSLLIPLASSLLAAGFLLLLRWLYWFFRRQEGIGLGDVKLMAMIAAWLGLEGTILVFAVGCLVGAVVALALLVWPETRRGNTSWAQTKLPLGSFLSLAAILAVFTGRSLIGWYQQWAGF